MDKRYIVVNEPADGFGGDVFQEIYNTLEEANAAASYDWDHLTRNEQRKRHVFAGVVTPEDLPEDAIDEDSGEIDWAAATSIDGFPGAFDSQPAISLAAAIGTVERLCKSEPLADMTADIFENDAWYDPDAAAWIVPVDMEDDDLGPRCGEYRFQVSKDSAAYELYRR